MVFDVVTDEQAEFLVRFVVVWGGVAGVPERFCVGRDSGCMEDGCHCLYLVELDGGG